VIGLSITTRGAVLEPTFKGKVRLLGAKGIVKKASIKGVQELVEIGEVHLIRMARRRPAGVFKTSTGHYWRKIETSTKPNPLDGRIFTNVIYGPWIEGTSSRNLTSRFKGYGLFRKTKDWLDTQSERVMGVWLKKGLR